MGVHNPICKRRVNLCTNSPSPVASRTLGVLLSAATPQHMFTWVMHKLFCYNITFTVCISCNHTFYLLDWIKKGWISVLECTVQNEIPHSHFLSKCVLLLFEYFDLLTVLGGGGLTSICSELVYQQICLLRFVHQLPFKAIIVFPVYCRNCLTYPPVSSLRVVFPYTTLFLKQLFIYWNLHKI